MKTSTMRWLIVFFLALIASKTTWAQTRVGGTIIDSSNGEPVGFATVMIKGTVTGIQSDANGKFALEVEKIPPFILEISYFSEQKTEVTITEAINDLEIKIDVTKVLDDIIIKPTLENPISDGYTSLEILDIKGIASSPGPDPYHTLRNLKGVDMITQSLTYQSVNMRGFGLNGNTRVVQMIDGVDNQAPGMNFPIGNAVGISELDLESIQLLQGPASALYGPNALQGTVIMTSKSPFLFEGISAYSKIGVNHVDERDDDMSLYNDVGFRFARNVDDRLAFKISGSMLRASDFIGIDTRDHSKGFPEFGVASRASDARVYDGVNIYGDNVLNLGSIADGIIEDGGELGAQILALRSLIPDGEPGNFSPLGYSEAEFVDNSTESIKLSGALHYRINENMELVGQYNYGKGSSVYTSNDRFILDNFTIWTGRLQLNTPSLLLRAYTTQENSGDSYAANTLAQLMLSENYIPTYFQSFVGARTQGMTVEEAHNFARPIAEASRLQVGTVEFKEAYDRLREIPIAKGAKFLDASDLWHYEGRYDFTSLLDSTFNLLVGGNYRQYKLNSQGTLFALDDDGNEIISSEYGTYMQISKSLGGLDLKASARYDKNQNFKGQFSPRLSTKFHINKNHILRASYQTGFRIPTVQNQFINLDVVSSRVVGRSTMLTDRWGFKTNPVYAVEDVVKARLEFAQGTDINTIMSNLEPMSFEDFKPEQVATYELGYRSSWFDGDLVMDGYAYFNRYTNYIVFINYMQTDNDNDSSTPNPDPSEADEQGIIEQTVDTQIFGANFNADGNIDTRGFGIDLSVRPFSNRGIVFQANTAYNELVDQSVLEEQGFDAEYNTPKWRHNIGTTYNSYNSLVGFSLNYRWQDAYIWNSNLGSGLVPAFGTLDAMVSYKLPALKSSVKLGGSNILNKRYTSSFGNPSIGAIYYLQITFDPSFIKSN